MKGGNQASLFMKGGQGRLMQGYTLLELSIAISISFILFLMAVPLCHSLIIKNQRQSSVDQLVSAIHFAHSEALKRNENIIFCGSSDRIHCDGQWSTAQIVKTQSRIIRIFYNASKLDQLHWRSNFSKNNFLQFAAMGFTEGQQGSFIYCPANKNNDDAQTITVTYTGRVRIFNGGDCAA